MQENQDYLPLAVLIFVVLSIRLDRASVRNFALVAIGALIAWSVAPTTSPWGKVVCYFLLALATVMSPLQRVFVWVLNSVRHMAGQESKPIHTVTNPDPIEVLHDPHDAIVE